MEVVEELIGRIEALNPALHAYLAVDLLGARAAAETAERAWRRGNRDALPLCGVPVSVKDTIEIAGMPTTYGSLAFRDHQAPDSGIGKQLRAAGAVIIGKTNTSEFALSTYTSNRLGEPTANPWNLEHTAGGSSGGAGAAVAAGLAPIGIGTDSTGSVRIPAAFTGVFGFKPTFGAIPARQQWRAALTRSHNGILSRTSADAQLTFQVLTNQHVVGTGTSPSVGDMRVAVVADGDDTAALKRAVEALRRLGADPTCVAAPPPVPEPGELEPGVWAYSGDHYAAAETLRHNFWERHNDELTAYAWPIYRGGSQALAWQYRQVINEAQEYARVVADWFTGYDLVVTPLAPEAPVQPANDREAGTGPYYPLVTTWNIAGNPAASIPMGKGPTGLPVAAQIVGAHGDDAGVLAAAAELEREVPWTHRWPDLAQ
ncbi:MULTISPECIES: amidase [unclassified Pseudonocardia]|uniref:amidase n=1 Tax=unclassified Pseudonocardia TaxID=2619320 RepID=UPI00143B6FAD|nr:MULTISPECIES: amidase [unclassified Pseudonocardia]